METKEKLEGICKECLIKDLKDEIERRQLDFSLLKNVNKDLKGRLLKKCEENRQLTGELGDARKSLKRTEIDRDEKESNWKYCCECIKQMIEKKCFGTDFHNTGRSECNECGICIECRHKVEKMSESQTKEESEVKLDGELGNSENSRIDM